MTEIIALGRAGARDAGNQDHGLLGILALGVDGKDLYLLSAITHQVVVLGLAEISEATLLALQTVENWKAHFAPRNNRQDFDVPRARAALAAACQAAGIFDPARLRGRGVWVTGDGRVVLHRGDYVWIDGAAYLPNAVPVARDIFPAQARLGELVGQVLPEGLGVRVLDALELAQWAHPVHARLTAGWIVTAPICATLRWRPHLWLTGPAQSGKSWLLQNVVAPLLGAMALVVEGGTTAAGIRQRLGADARPCAFDEAEAHKASGLSRIEGIMEMARAMSSELSAEVLKGGSGHKAVSFAGVTQFCLASIGVPLARTADITRWTLVELRPRPAMTAEERLASAETVAAIGGSFARDLLATTIAHLPTLLANAELLASAIERRTGVRRLGDQLGTLLAGELLLRSHARLTPEEADQEADGLPLDLLTGQALESDEDRLWNLIFAATVAGDTHSGRRPVKRTLGQMVQIALGTSGREIEEDGIPQGEARQALVQLGMMVRPDPDTAEPALFMLNSHPALSALLRGTDFPEGWHRVLQRIPGVRPWPVPVRLPGMRPARGTLVPLKLFLSQKV